MVMMFTLESIFKVRYQSPLPRRRRLWIEHALRALSEQYESRGCPVGYIQLGSCAKAKPAHLIRFLTFTLCFQTQWVLLTTHPYLHSVLLGVSYHAACVENEILYCKALESLSIECDDLRPIFEFVTPLLSLTREQDLLLSLRRDNSIHSTHSTSFDYGTSIVLFQIDSHKSATVDWVLILIVYTQRLGTKKFIRLRSVQRQLSIIFV